VRPGQAVVEVPNTSSFGTMRVVYANGSAASVPVMSCRPMKHSFVNLNLNADGNWMTLLKDPFVFGIWLDTPSGQAYLRTLYNNATPEKAFKWWGANKWNAKYEEDSLSAKRKTFIAGLMTRDKLKNWMYKTEPGQEYMTHLKKVCNPDDVFKWNIARDFPEMPEDMEDFCTFYKDNIEWDAFLLSPFGLQWLATKAKLSDAADFRNTVVFLEREKRMGRRLEREIRSMYPEGRDMWMKKMLAEEGAFDQWLISQIGREYLMTLCYRQEGQLTIRQVTAEDAYTFYFKEKRGNWPWTKHSFFLKYKTNRAEFALFLQSGWGLQYLKTFAEYEDCVRWRGKMGAKAMAPGVDHPGINNK